MKTMYIADTNIQQTKNGKFYKGCQIVSQKLIKDYPQNKLYECVVEE